MLAFEIFVFLAWWAPNGAAHVLDVDEHRLDHLTCVYVYVNVYMCMYMYVYVYVCLYLSDDNVYMDIYYIIHTHIFDVDIHRRDHGRSHTQTQTHTHTHTYKATHREYTYTQTHTLLQRCKPQASRTFISEIFLISFKKIPRMFAGLPPSLATHTPHSP